MVKFTTLAYNSVEYISHNFCIGAAETGQQGEPSSGQIPPSGGQSALNDAATASVEQRVRGPAGVPLSSDWSSVDLCVANLVPIDSHHQRARTSGNLPPRGATVRPDN